MEDTILYCSFLNRKGKDKGLCTSTYLFVYKLWFKSDLNASVIPAGYTICPVLHVKLASVLVSADSVQAAANYPPEK